MKFKHFIIIFVISIFLFGCATLPGGDGKILSFKIKPDKGLRPGMIVSVEVKTTDDIEKVFGTIEIPGAMTLPLKYNKTKKMWAFAAMIPMTPIPQGEFTAKVEAISKSGEKYTATTKISTKQ